MRRLVTACLALVLAACAHAPASAPADAAGTPADAWHGARQLVLVTVAGWDDIHGRMHRYQREPGGAWRSVGNAQPVVIGRSGAAWGLGLHPQQAGGPHKREGDGRAPAGVFTIGPAFGYAASATTGLRYLPMDRDHWCMDVPASPLYNRIVDARQAGQAAVQGSSEPMRLDLHANGDMGYKAGFVIGHNAGNLPGMGSCIFAHLWKTPDTPTAGCTAMTETSMTALLGWLREDAEPVFVLLPRAEYDRLRHAWHLPELTK